MTTTTKISIQEKIEKMQRAVAGIRGAQAALEWMDNTCTSEGLQYHPMIAGELSSGVMVLADMLDHSLEDLEKLLVQPIVKEQLGDAA